MNEAAASQNQYLVSRVRQLMFVTYMAVPASRATLEDVDNALSTTLHLCVSLFKIGSLPTDSNKMNKVV
jgi:hypothetical protein